MEQITYLRSFRIFQIALFDIISSIVGLYMFIKYMYPNKPQEFYISWTLLLVMPISVVSHVLFSVPTMFNYYLGLSARPI